MYEDVPRMLQGYVRSLLDEDEVLRQARERSAQEDMPPAPPEVGALIGLLVRLTEARQVLELGTGAGLSGVWIARNLPPEGKLTTVDVDEEHQRLAALAYEEAGVRDKVTLVLGSATEVMRRMPSDSFDLVFIDTAKSEAPVHLDEAIRLVRTGGLIVGDDTLWHGRVADPHSSAPETEGAATFNDRLFSTPVLQSVILPFANGVSLSLVEKRDSDR